MQIRLSNIGWPLLCFASCTLLSLFISHGKLSANEPQANPASSVAAIPAELPPGELGRVIAVGRDIVQNTKDHPLSKAYVGNALNCTSCHLDNGTHPQAASFIGVATAYPAWSPREKRVVTLEDRLLNCFMRSQNGTRPPLGSEVSVAIAAYITWLSTAQPIRQNADFSLGPNHTPALTPATGVTASGDIDRGKALYADHCADCHGEKGLGSEDGPPVWGSQSYNDGAGLSRVPKLASWLKVAMPLDDAYLTEQEAFDIAAFINSHPRPKFKLENHLPQADRLGEYNSQ